MKTFFRTFKNNWILFVPVCAFIIGKTLLFQTYFFWDSVAGLSRPALFLYQNNFSSFNFPLGTVDDNLFITSILAIIWKIFGCTLLVSHIFSMLVGVAIIYQLYKLCLFFIPDRKKLPFVYFLVLSDAALVTQSLILMTDPAIILFAIMSVNYMLRQKEIAFSLSLFGLALIRARGFDLCIGIGFSYYILLLQGNQWKKPLHVLATAIIPFIPAIAAYLGSIIFRSIEYHSFQLCRKDPSWANSLDLVNLKGFAKNVFSMIRCFADTGRCFLWLTMLLLFIKYKKKIFIESNSSSLWILFIGSLLMIIPITLFVQNTMGMKYFIFEYIMFSLTTGILLFSLLEIRVARIVAIILILGLWTGNLWRYPEKLSVSWDTTLAHIPYYGLRKQMLQYIDQNKINYKETGSFFPATAKSSEIELSNDDRKFATLDLRKNKYVIYSNIGNMSDELIDTIKSWKMIKEYRQGAVFIQLYENVK